MQEDNFAKLMALMSETVETLNATAATLRECAELVGDSPSAAFSAGWHSAPGLSDEEINDFIATDDLVGRFDSGEYAEPVAAEPDAWPLDKPEAPQPGDDWFLLTDSAAEAL